MQRVITYLYPKEDLASSLKVFQDRTNQIKGFYFTRDNIKEVEHLESGRDYAVYFLFDQSENGDMSRVYVGQSKNGAYRMNEHNRTKMFWSHCLMFVTDNSSFDMSTIDYLEYYFIDKLKGSGQYLLENQDLRNKRPNVSMYDMPMNQAYIRQIEFLLKAEGVDLDLEEQVAASTITTDDTNQESDKIKYYYPINSSYKAKVFYKGGKFLLAKGSEVLLPPESVKHYTDGGKLYHRAVSTIQGFIKDGKIERRDGKYIATANLLFNSISTVANIITGKSVNGWDFFQDISELRE